MADSAKIFNEQFLDGNGDVYGYCYAEFRDSTGASRKAVWTDRDKTLPSTSGTVLDIVSDAEGRIVAYGDGLYQVTVKTSGGTTIKTFEDVQLLDGMESYTGDTAAFTITDFESRFRSGQMATNSVTGGGAVPESLFDLDLFDGSEHIYLVTGDASSIFQYDKMTGSGYTAGRIIVLVGESQNPVKFRSWQTGDASSTYNMKLGEDVYLRTGDALTLWWDGEFWHAVSYYRFHDYYTVLSGAGLGSGADVILTSDDDVVKITGTNEINNIWFLASGMMAPAGRKLDIIFSGALVVNNEPAGNLMLGGDFTTAANSVLSLVSDGSNWHRRDSRDINEDASSVLQVATAAPSVGAARVWYTGGDNTDITHFAGATEGARITIVHNETDSPDIDYLNVRKKIESNYNTSEGYVVLKNDLPFYMLDGDTLDLICLTDAADVLYWREVGRTEDMTPIPVIDITSGTLPEIWKSHHKIKNTGGSQTVTTLPDRPMGFMLSFTWYGTGQVTFNQAGNIRVFSGYSITLSQVDEAFTFMSKNEGTSVDWVQMSHTNADV